MDDPWRYIAHLRKTNRAVYGAIEDLVGVPSPCEDATLILMQRFYAKYPVLARAVHRDILRNDRLILDHSTEMAYEE